VKILGERFHRKYAMNTSWLLCFLFLCAFCDMLPAGGPEQARRPTIAERLNCPRDAKLLIIHGDDLAVAHSVDSATFAALDQKAISSASVMVPCPWLSEVAAYAKGHPEADLGIHLTLTSEWQTYRWGPTAPTDRVPSLLDAKGYLWASSALVGAQVKPDEAEREIRAQIERALSLGIRPTHLDNHMRSLYQTPEHFAVYLKVAREYHLPLKMVHVPAQLLGLLTDRDIVLDDDISMVEGVRPEQWTDYYARILRAVKPGLTQLTVHLGHEDAELTAITVDHPSWGAAWRQRDFDVVSSAAFKEILKENGITVIRWGDLQKLL
jgi:predicted glycoside hydrolase/deacetylase ChbG (UPF0249 family)